MSFKLTLVGLSALALATSAQAGNLIQNGNFAVTNLVDGGGVSTYYRQNLATGSIADWTYNIPGGAGNNNNGIITVLASDNLNGLNNQSEGPYSFWNASNGGVGTIATPPSGNAHVLGQDSAPENAAYLSQSINGLTAGKTYVLTFAFAGAQLRNSDGSLWNGATNEGVTVNLGGTYDLSGGTTSQSYTGGTTDTVYYDNYAVSVPEHGSTPWQQAEMFFTATGTTETLNLEAISTSAGDPPFALIDNLQMFAVPEPATWAMMLMGVFGMGAVARRRRGGRLATA